MRMQLHSLHGDSAGLLWYGYGVIGWESQEEAWHTRSVQQSASMHAPVRRAYVLSGRVQKGRGPMQDPSHIMKSSQLASHGPANNEVGRCQAAGEKVALPFYLLQAASDLCSIHQSSVILLWLRGIIQRASRLPHLPRAPKYSMLFLLLDLHAAQAVQFSPVSICLPSSF